MRRFEEIGTAIAFMPILLGLTFFLPLEAGAQELTAAVVSETAIARGAEWKLFRGRAEPAGGTLEWTEAGFDDGAWETGEAGVGYGDLDDATVLSDMKDRYSTVYLRKGFDVADPTRVSHLELSIDYDDGFVAFLNGVEIARSNAGPTGSPPAHDDLATHDHEAGTAEAFIFVGASSLLTPEGNVLAVVGLNGTLDSSDFSLHPELRLGGPLAVGCTDDFYVTGDEALLAGTVPPGTAAVRVDGAAASLDPGGGTWSLRAPVPDAATVAPDVEALDSFGGVIATKTLRLIRVTPISGGLDADLTIPATGSPYLVAGRVTVPAGRSLTVEAGCDFLIRPGVGFLVQGQVRALGSPEAPIRFTRVPCGESWGFFTFEGTRGDNLFRSCEWSFSGGDPGCLTVTESDLELDGCTLRDIDGEGVHAVRSKTRIRDCLTERTQEALSLDYGDTVVEGCTIRNTVGKSDLIDVNFSDPPARIAFNHLYGTSDDGIDVDGGATLIEGNVIHDCGDQAMSLVGEGSSTVLFNVCYANTHGLSVKDSHSCLAEHNTFALHSDTGVRAIEKTAGRGGGIIVLRDSIVWGNATQLLVESTGSIDVAYSDVEGATPPGEGNVSLDPLFVEPEAADFRLDAASPCIGADLDGDDLGALPFGAGPPPYPRGDANGNRRRDVTDVIFTLSFLFQSGDAPPCRDLADSNGDGDVDVSDPVFLLLFLFGGGRTPFPDEATCDA